MAGASEGRNLTCTEVKVVRKVLTEVNEKLKNCVDGLPPASCENKDSEECDHDDCLTDILTAVKAWISQIEQRTATHVRPTSNSFRDKEQKTRDSGMGSASEETLKQEKRKGMVLPNDDNLNQPTVTKVEDKRLNVPSYEMLQQEAQTSVKTLDDGTCVSSDSIESNVSDDDNTKVDYTKKRGK